MKQDKKDYAAEIIKRLKKKYGKIRCALVFNEPYELLFATILSAQCTDERVNIVTAELFKRYKTVKDYAGADVKELEKYIHSAGFYRNKAKNIIGSAKMIVEKYGGKVPETMEELLVLPGVARKTANVVLGNAFNKAEGIAVDTHVIRIANLLKLTKSENPVLIEQDLMKLFHKKQWTDISHLIQTLGRRVCKARNPNHEICPLKDICPSKNV